MYRYLYFYSWEEKAKDNEQWALLHVVMDSVTKSPHTGLVSQYKYI
jgi:hypothetical protein